MTADEYRAYLDRIENTESLGELAALASELRDGKDADQETAIRLQMAIVRRKARTKAKP